MRNKVAELLEQYPDLEELFEVLDIPLEEVITCLLQQGLVVLPPWLEDLEEDEDEDAN